MTKRRDFASFTAEDVLVEWLSALKKGLGSGRKFAPEIIDLQGDVAKRLRKSINAQLSVRPFDALAFRASTRVATDLGAICRIMATATRDKVVTKDVFDKARDLSKLHASCPAPTVAGRGPYC